jgi:hypothetical protein
MLRVRMCLAYVYVEKSGGLDEHSASGILTRRRRKRSSAQGGAKRNPGVRARKHPALKELRNGSNEIFAAKLTETRGSLPHSTTTLR